LKKYVLTVDVVVEVPDEIDPASLGVQFAAGAVRVITTDGEYRSDVDEGGVVTYMTTAVEAVEELS
jgi:hypothetical protein